MRRISVILVVSWALLAAPALASAGRPIGGCPAAGSGYDLVDQQTWWDRTVEGFIAEGIQVYVDGNPGLGFTAQFDAFATDAGFAGAEGLYVFVWGEQWVHIDKNGDLVVCMKPRPHTPGNPAFYFNGIDNTAG